MLLFLFSSFMMCGWLMLLQCVCICTWGPCVYVYVYVYENLEVECRPPCVESPQVRGMSRVCIRCSGCVGLLVLVRVFAHVLYDPGINVDAYEALEVMCDRLNAHKPAGELR